MTNEAIPLREKLQQMPAPEPREARQRAGPQVPAGTPPEAADTLSEAEAARESLKQRIRTEHAHASRDLDYAQAQIAEAKRAIAMHQTNVIMLEAIAKAAEERILNCKFAMSRVV